MSINFNSKTGNISEFITSGKTLMFNADGELYKARDVDTLVYYEDRDDNSWTQQRNLFKNILKDPTNPRKIKYCPECKKDELIVMIRIGGDLFNKCIVCKKQWIEGIE